jgi:alpha-tubulin suppressor-like RCC1 family protein
VTVQGLPAQSLIDAAGGLGHTCAVTSSGALYCWGNNSSGELGVGNRTSTSTARLVPGITGVTAVCAGIVHTCALAGGRTYCWGQIPTGAADPTVPTLVAGADGLVELECGDEYACGRRASGELYCWGSNVRGALGTGDVMSRSAPTLVAGFSASALATGAGGHTCALRADGTAACWGLNDQGQLGDGTFVDRLTPTAVIDLP